MRRALPCVLLAVAAGGCRVGPDYETPALEAVLPERWTAEESGAGVDDVAAWWTLLEDTELAALVERALAGSFDVAEARERIVAARARRGIENAARLPTIDAEASYERAATGEEGLVLGGAPPGSEVDIYSLGVVAGWEIDLWGRVARLVEAADAEIDLAVEDFRAARVALASEVAREVVEIRSLTREIELVEATVEADRESLEIAIARERAGFAGGLDVSRAERELESDLALLPQLRADRRAAELRLAVLLGEPAGAQLVVERGLPRRDVLPDLGVPADLLLRRPDLRRAERDLAAATARIGAAEAERYPRVAISGSLALQGPDIGDTVAPDAYILRAGPSISVPVFEGGRIGGRVREAESLQRQALLRLQRGVVEAIAEVEIAAMRRDRAEERAGRLAAAERSARETETLSLDRYQAGAVDFLVVTEARTQRLAIELDLVRAERDAVLRLVDLYAALGGGWEGPASDDASADTVADVSDPAGPARTR